MRLLATLATHYLPVTPSRRARLSSSPLVQTRNRGHRPFVSAYGPTAPRWQSKGPRLDTTRISLLGNSGHRELKECARGRKASSRERQPWAPSWWPSSVCYTTLCKILCALLLKLLLVQGKPDPPRAPPQHCLAMAGLREDHWAPPTSSEKIPPSFERGCVLLARLVCRLSLSTLRCRTLDSRSPHSLAHRAEPTRTRTAGQREVPWAHAHSALPLLSWALLSRALSRGPGNAPGGMRGLTPPGDLRMVRDGRQEGAATDRLSLSLLNGLPGQCFHVSSSKMSCLARQRPSVASPRAAQHHT